MRMKLENVEINPALERVDRIHEFIMKTGIGRGVPDAFSTHNNRRQIYSKRSDKKDIKID